MIAFVVKSGPYSSSRVKEVLRAAVGMTLTTDVEVLLIGPGQRCLEISGSEWAEELDDHLSTVEELGTLSIGHGRLGKLIQEADGVITV